MHKINRPARSSMLTVMSASAFAARRKMVCRCFPYFIRSRHTTMGKTSDKFMPVPMVNYEGKTFISYFSDRLLSVE